MGPKWLKTVTNCTQAGMRRRELLGGNGGGFVEPGKQLKEQAGRGMRSGPLPVMTQIFRKELHKPQSNRGSRSHVTMTPSCLQRSHTFQARWVTAMSFKQSPHLLTLTTALRGTCATPLSRVLPNSLIWGFRAQQPGPYHLQKWVIL